MNTLAVVGGLSKSGGGTSYSVPSWSNELAKLKVKRILVTIQKDKEETSDFLDETAVKLISINSTRSIFSNKFYSPQLDLTLEQICVKENIDLIHNHGVWLPINHSISKISQKLKIPMVVTPHGMLTQWSFQYKNLKKKLAWRLYQQKDLENAKAIHVTSKSEGEDLRKFGYRGAIAVIPHGVIIPKYQNPRFKKRKTKTALFVSRIHPKKGLLNLVKAWAEVRPINWRMILVGPDENGYMAVIQKVIQKYGLKDDFVYLGPVYGKELSNLYRKSDLFILPSFNENFGNAVTEALAHGIPVITTQGTPWEELNTHDCGWWIPIGSESLSQALRKATEISGKELQNMGLRGRKLVESKYTWKSTGKKMKILYEWILGKGIKPPFLLPE